MIPGEPLLTPPQVAERLHISLGVVYRYIKSGDLPALRVGPRAKRGGVNKFRVPESAVSRLLVPIPVGPESPSDNFDKEARR